MSSTDFPHNLDANASCVRQEKKQVQLKDIIWPIIGISAALFSLHLLFGELKNISWEEIWQGLAAIPPLQWVKAVLSTFLAYGALAWYDQITLRHLGYKLRWGYVSLVSFCTYALSHNIGASAFTGAVIRYRAYSVKGLSLAEVGIMVALCSLTFGLGVAMLSGWIFILSPHFVARTLHLPQHIVPWLGGGLIACVLTYAAGSLLNLPTLKLGKVTLAYPRPQIVVRQLIAGPLELLGAAGIIYFTLPEISNPGYIMVLGAFLLSFSSALISHAPGGLGVLEYVCLKALPDSAPHHLIVALIVFRLLYLLLPFAFSISVVLWFERGAIVNLLWRRGCAEKSPGDGGTK